MDVPVGQDSKSLLNPTILEVLTEARLEPPLLTRSPGDRFQFERTGYFAVDVDFIADRLVFNRTVGLKGSWAKIEAKQ